MCKFSSTDDSGYRRIEAELHAVILEIQDTTREGAAAQAESSSTFPSH